MYAFWVLLLTITTYVNGQNASFPDCKAGPLAAFSICNSSLSSRQRAVDLVSRLNISEKISRMGVSASAITRLGLPTYSWYCEGLHGIAYSLCVHFGGDLPAATSFPMTINLGATFNMTLINRMASVISTEARAFNNEGRAGLSFFTPNINIFRDPRWGRGEETVGEDPFLGSQYVYALVTGLQGGDTERYLKVAATCKHFVAYDLEKWNGTDRFHFNAIISDQDIVETQLPPFESCIRDARVASIMCSFNEINGVPACANQFFLQTIAR
jgi:beta-D-xylosidase 4